MQMDYEVGDDPTRLVPRIISRVIPGEHIGMGCRQLPAEPDCLAQRNRASDERWRLTCASHEAEIFRIRHLIESRHG